MTRLSQAYTIPAEIHARPTRIMRAARQRDIARATVIATVSVAGSPCHRCSTALELDAQFCGICGARVRVRTSRQGDILDGLYTVEELIADGAMAAVYRAIYLPTRQEIALKILHPEIALDHASIVRFRREARCALRVRHANIVAALDHGETADGKHYLAMELLRGESLATRLAARGRHPWRDVFEVMREIAGALAEIHANGIIHRDVCLRNVIRGTDGQHRLIDFGVAKLWAHERDDDLKSLGCTAPEILADEPCDHRADLHALGVLGRQLLLGRASSLRTERNALPSDVPADAHRVLTRCVSADRNARFASARELLQELERVLVPPRRCIMAHTSAFELQPPKIAVLADTDPKFLARGSEPAMPTERVRRPWWRGWR